MKKFLIIDTSHMLHRARHSVRGDIWDQSGLALHVMLNSIKKCWNNFDSDHVVFCLDGKSWRTAIYEPYKKNRKTKAMLKTPNEIEDDKYFYSVIDEFTSFIAEKTNCTVLHNPIAEADDLIARWVQTHPDDFHVIVSGDTDFLQMISPNCVMYDGINDRTIKHNGILNDKRQIMEFNVKSDAKLKVLEPMEDFLPAPDWIEWAMFVKYVRGDTSDNIFSAFPGARLPKIRKVFDDRVNKGFEWNNFMLSSWTDHEGVDHLVRDGYERNIELIDLSKQPDIIKDTMDETINDAVAEEKHVSNLGLHFMKFANKHELARVLQHKEDYLQFLKAPYSEGVND